MSLHTTSGRWRLGLFLSLITTVMWGLLPLGLKVMLDVMDAITLTWYRFLAAAILLFPFVFRKKSIDAYKRLRGRWIILFFAAALGVSANYVVYLLGLNHLTPSAATVLIQLAPMLLLLGGIFVFKERFTLLQWSGFTAFVIGLLLFFNDRLAEIFLHRSDYSLGILFIVIAAFLWAGYGLAQKQILKIFPSVVVMHLIYVFAVFFFLPIAKPSQILTLDTPHLLVLAFCALNTLIAYGSFAEALAHWEASRISAILTLVPIVTFVAMKALTAWAPSLLPAEQINILSLFGAALVIAGSMLCALGKNASS